jgi:hypothetical protein
MRPSAPHRSLRRLLPSARAAVRVHIGRLVLHSVALADAGRLTAALEAELADLAAEPGQFFAPASAPRATTAHFEAPEGPERIGRAAGAALWSGIQQSGRAER